MFRRGPYIAVGAVIAVIGLLAAAFAYRNEGTGLRMPDLKEKITGMPSCPANLSGILTTPLIELKHIRAITPLGNLNPPGHTSPVDHNYFVTDFEGQIPLYAPADAKITEITEISYRDENGQYIPGEYVVRYVICDGLSLDFAGYRGLEETILRQFQMDRNDCKFDIQKPGHDRVEGQCYFKTDIKVRSGDRIGYTQLRENGSLPFEIWAANYNKPARADVNWKYYDDDRYSHAMCTLDLYSGELRDEFYSKLGSAEREAMKEADSRAAAGGYIFRPRTVQPLCGQVNQDIPGTLQGMWFGDGLEKAGQIEFEGKGLSFIHNNIDPAIAEIGVGGTIAKPGVIQFKPVHSGTIDREFNEITSDGKVYCFNSPVSAPEQNSGRILVKMVSPSEIQAEFQTGPCRGQESLVDPYTYKR